MANLFGSISKILDKNIRLELYSTLNQHLLGSSNIVLWNEEVQTIDAETYEKFRLAIKKSKTCAFYNLAKTLPFHDFCIALLCCVDYGLNEKTASIVPSRTYTFAWRSLMVLADTAEDSVQDWIKKRLSGRTNDGYTTSLGIIRQNIVSTKRRHSDTRGLSKLAIDEDKISRACMSNKIKDMSKNIPAAVTPVIVKSTATPEGQLVSLRILHKLLLSKNF